MANLQAGDIRQRSGKVEQKDPIITTTEIIDTKEHHPGGKAHHPALQVARIVALVLYFLGCCLRYAI